MINISTQKEFDEAVDKNGIIQNAIIASNKMFTNCTRVIKMINVRIGNETKLTGLKNLEAIKKSVFGSSVEITEAYNLSYIDIDFEGPAKLMNLSSLQEIKKTNIPEGVILHGIIRIEAMQHCIIEGEVYHHGSVKSLKNIRLHNNGHLTEIDEENIKQFT